MKVWLFAALAVVVGLGVGVGMTISRVGGIRDDADLVVPAKVAFGSEVRAPELPPEEGPQPKFVLDDATHDFGSLEVGQTGSHAFVIRNEGEYPLVLRRGETTCKCTMSKLGDGEDGLEEAKVAPGGQIDVTLSWEIKPNSEANFRQTAVIFSNDRDRWRVVLTIEGRVEASVFALPPMLSVNDMLPGEDTHLEFTLGTKRTEDLQIVNYRWLNDKQAEYFELQHEPTPPNSGATGGALSYRGGVLGKVTVKHGLPPGPVQQTLELETNLADVPPTKIPIGGSISGHMSIRGSGYRTINARRGMLSLGIIERGQPLSRELKLSLRGPRRGEVRPKIVEVRPSALQITLGEPIPRDAIVEILLRVEIPADSPPLRYTGGHDASGSYLVEKYAEFVVDGGGEEYGQLQVLVQVALGER